METKDIIVENIPVSQNFLPEPITDDQYVLGDAMFGVETIMPDGDWEKWLPVYETQFKNGVEPSSCAMGGTLNCLECIGRKKYGVSFQSDLSERYGSIMMGMNGNGGNPHTAAEVIRKDAGAIPEVFLPFNDKINNLKQYFSPSPMSYNLFKVGLHWTKKYEVKHTWLFTYGSVKEKRDKIKNALKSSPVGVALYAWSLHADGKYYNDGPPIHWTIIFRCVENGNSDDHYKCLDTYPPFIKKLDINFDFSYAKMYSLNRRLGSENISDETKSVVFPYVIYLIKWLVGRTD